MKRKTSNPFTHFHTSRTSPKWCPVCFHKLDSVSCVTAGEVPRVGDFTVCIECASVLRFNAMMDMELSTLEDIPTHSRMLFARMVTTLKELQRVRSKPRPN